MPVLIAILAAVGAAIWYYVRSNPRDAIDTAGDLITTARNAPRRLAFRRQTKEHPVEGIDDPAIAIAGIAQAFIELDDLPTKELRDRLHVLLRSKLRLSEEEAQEIQVLARWLQEQCGGATPAVPRLARRLRKIDGEAHWDTLTDMLGDLAGDGLSSAQEAAIEDIRIAFRRRS